jgi:division protein CdvB (Snf7/Vps24/ESCRT-III family)
MDLANSDFAAVYFSTADVKHFQALLVRLRTFEKNVADEFRQVNAKIDALDQASKINKTGITVAKGSITKLRNSLNKMGDWVKTQFENMNHSVEEFDEDEANLVTNASATLLACPAK